MGSTFPMPSGEQPHQFHDQAKRRKRRIGLIVAACGAALLPVVVALSSAPREPAPVAHGILPKTSSGATVREQRAGSPTGSRTTTTTTPVRGPRPAAPPIPAAPLRIENTTLLSPEDVPAAGITLPIQTLGRIQIPKIGLDEELRDQITQESIDLGPSHWPGTALPGGLGNTVIAGHRNSHSAPFRDLANLAPGDTIALVASGRTFNYSVTELFVVNPDAVWITEQGNGRSLTLFTCHPLGESYQRLVIRAALT